METLQKNGKNWEPAEIRGDLYVQQRFTANDFYGPLLDHLNPFKKSKCFLGPCTWVVDRGKSTLIGLPSGKLT